MKHIKESSVEQLNLKYKNKKIYCVGCGKRLFELIELYSSEPFINNISGLFDNNSKLWDVEKEIGSIKLKIENPVSIKQLSDVVILITSDHYEDIFKSIQEYLCNKNVYVFRYPQYYYRWTGKLLKFFSYMPLSRQILFYAGAEPHENADAIVSYLNKEYKGKKYSIVYLSDNENFSYNGIKYIYSKTVRCRANFFEVFDYCRLYSRSKFLCYENQALKKVSSKQCLIYLNHGTIPLKNVSDVLRQPEELDIGVCPGKGCANFYIDQYGITPEKQVYMMPARVNRMFKSEGKIHDLLKIDHKKVVLWLPTFRQLKGSERKDSASLNPIELLFYRAGYTLQVLGNAVVLQGSTHGQLLYNTLTGFMKSTDPRVIVGSTTLGYAHSTTSMIFGPALLDFGLYAMLIQMLLIGFIIGMLYNIQKSLNTAFVGLYAMLLAHVIIWIETGPTDLVILLFFLIAIIIVLLTVKTKKGGNI